MPLQTPTQGLLCPSMSRRSPPLFDCSSWQDAAARPPGTGACPFLRRQTSLKLAICTAARSLATAPQWANMAIFLFLYVLDFLALFWVVLVLVKVCARQLRNICRTLTE